MSSEEQSEQEEEETDGQEEKDEDIRYFVRVGTTDLDGTESIETALTGMDGIGRRASKTIAREVGVDPKQLLGKLGDDDVEEIKEAIQNFDDVAPEWMLNREKDYYTGENRHVVGRDVEIVREEDINRMKKIRSYKGIRHERGQKVRGQRTRSTGRTGGTVGVKVSEVRAEEEEGGEE